MALIGYARVSTAEQDTALQTDALRHVGCEQIYEDTVSGANSDRPGLAGRRVGLSARRRRAGRLATGSAWPLAAASDRGHRRAGSAWRRVPVADGKH